MTSLPGGTTPPPEEVRAALIGRIAMLESLMVADPGHTARKIQLTEYRAALAVIEALEREKGEAYIRGVERADVDYKFVSAKLYAAEAREARLREAMTRAAALWKAYHDGDCAHDDYRAFAASMGQLDRALSGVAPTPEKETT